jgi:hypothetical protein
VDEPVVYVSTWRIMQGQFDDYQRFYDELWKMVEANEPDVVAFVAFANDALSEITNVHVFPDAATLDRHMSVIGERMKLLPDDLTVVTQFMEPLSIQVYGRPSGPAAEMDQGLRDSGVQFTDRPRYLGGFIRRSPAAH